MSGAAIVDYGLGNLFSIRQACKVAGLAAEISSDRVIILSADIVILPGVGAFGNAMKALRRLDLIEPLREFAASGKPLFGVCLGMQLLMDGSEEFGRHAGLGLIAGSVQRLPAEQGLKVPKIGWARVDSNQRNWKGTPLEGVANNAYFYFVHSYYVAPRDSDATIAVSRFGSMDYCCAIRHGSIFGVQFHPERSGRTGIAMYANLLRLARPTVSLAEAQ